MMKFVLLLLLPFSLLAQQPATDTVVKTFKQMSVALEEINRDMKGALNRMDSIGVFSPEQSAAKTAYEKLNSYIMGLKNDLSNHPEDNITYTQQLFFTRKEGNNIYTRLKKYKQLLLPALPEGSARKTADSILTHLLYVPPKKSWTGYYFKNIPVVAAYTILSKIQNDLLTCERLMIWEKRKL